MCGSICLMEEDDWDEQKDINGKCPVRRNGETYEHWAARLYKPMEQVVK